MTTAIDTITQHIQNWGSGYFFVNTQGELCVRSQQGSISLAQLAQQLQETQFSFPLIVRFLDILEQQLSSLANAFSNSLAEQQLDTRCLIAYPIKVNQHQKVVETLLNTALPESCVEFGLEVGSKPELLVALACARPSQPIICNGYKDQAFIELALIGQDLGFNTCIVIEKLSEVVLIAQASQHLQVKPNLGVRVRLDHTGQGNWQNTGGHKAKFGLNAPQLMMLISLLQQHALLDQLSLLHIHIGSQVSSLKDIEQCIEEAARYYTELRQLDVPIEYFDVGGGLAIDYQGEHSDDYFSANYSMTAYAQVIVEQLNKHCKAASQPFPTLVAESGRALTAHHAMILTKIIDHEPPPKAQTDTEPPLDTVSHRLWSIHQQSKHLTSIESCQDLWSQLDICHQAVTREFFYKTLDLNEKAQCECWFYSGCLNLYTFLAHQLPVISESTQLNDCQHLMHVLSEWVNTKYFLNLSMFQSIPDVWGINQLFPIYPLSGLQQNFDQPAKLYDITCDSDGRIDDYTQPYSIHSHLQLPNWPDDEQPTIGIFLTGAYQEILGDIHNLFGTTDAVSLRITADNHFSLVHHTQGDTASDVLQKVNYSAEDLLSQLISKIRAHSMTESQQNTYLNIIRSSLDGYTYHDAKKGKDA